MPSPFAPLRHRAFRLLWSANLAGNVGLWVQNTAAAWMMTALAPSATMVSSVQVAGLLPVVLLGLPAGALADIVDRRLFLIGAQVWILAMAVLLAVLTGGDALGAWGLLALTFAIGIGNAMNFPAWAATTPELVPREDLVQAIALNGIGFNLARAVGPALGGFAIAWAGVDAAFALVAACFALLIGALAVWRPERSRSAMPREHFLGAIRAGLRFVAASPPMRAVMVRACVFFFFTAAVWGLLPLVIRGRLGLGPGAYGLMLGLMGVGAVAGGLLMPVIRARMPSRGTAVLAFSLLSAASLALLAVAEHWAVAGLSMLGFGLSWIGAASTLQVSAQLAAPAWVRARAMGTYQTAFFAAMVLGSAIWGWAGEAAGLGGALGLCAATGAAAASAVRDFRLDATPASPSAATDITLPQPEAPAAELAGLLAEQSGRVLEVVRYTIPEAERSAFLSAMEEVRRVRLRNGAVAWRLLEDIAHPEKWIELWAVESWAEHLREETRMDESDRVALASAAALHRGEPPPEAARYLVRLK
ncbi:MAG TPA: MFS transporter [Acetobacteraceae bacterium]|nr:MFS transporter [Acetobacteraceae bacterium]